jgi:hypothetical protein
MTPSVAKRAWYASENSDEAQTVASRARLGGAVAGCWQSAANVTIMLVTEHWTPATNSRILIALHYK